MADTAREVLLFELAMGQHGYVTAAQARAVGYSPALLAYHAQRGRLQRIRRGLYRLRDYPPSIHEEIVAAWLAVGRDVAVVSHESALVLHELSDVVPTAVNLTVPRTRRYLASPPGVQLHTTLRPLAPNEVTTREGVLVTAPVRTILDAAEIGTAPDQVVLAVQQGVRRGLFLPEMLAASTQTGSQRVRDLISLALQGAGA